MSNRLSAVVIVLLWLSTGSGYGQPSITTSGSLQFDSGTGDKATHLIGVSAIEVDGRPVACFGLTKAPGQKPQYSYLFLFNASAKGGGINLETSGGGSTLTEDFHIDHQTKLQVGKVTAEVAYKCKYDPKAEKLTGEALQIGGKPVALSEGRVFLVDVRGEKATYKLLKGDKLDLLPQQLPKGGYQQGVLDTIEKLRKDSTEVKKFLE